MESIVVNVRQKKFRRRKMNRREIKNILEKEIKNHHEKETSYRRCKRSPKKIIKHMHKKHKIIDIARKLGFTFCECCGGLK